jgi:hypothetical protein
MESRIAAIWRAEIRRIEPISSPPGTQLGNYRDIKSNLGDYRYERYVMTQGCIQLPGDPYRRIPIIAAAITSSSDLSLRKSQSPRGALCKLLAHCSAG